MRSACAIGWATLLAGVCAGCAGRGEGARILAEDDLPRFVSDPPGAVQAAAVEGEKFGRGLRIMASSGGAVSAQATVNAPIQAGDVLLLRFHLRSREDREARIEARFEPEISRWSSALRMAARSGPAWKIYEYPFSARRDYAPGESRVEFRVRGGEPSVEIGGVELRNYGQRGTKDGLPCTRLDYAGSEPGAAWRQAAAERIERIRKGDLVVSVHDAAGAPVPDVEVNVRMKRHAFGFGSVVNVALLTGQRDQLAAADLERYRKVCLRLFSKAVVVGALKWPQWEQPGTPERVSQVVDWLTENRIPLRGHVLVWPSWRWLPARLKELEKDPPALRAAVREHIREEASALRGKVCEWDVINEPYSNHDLMDILGKDVMVEWFQDARRADPDVKLYLNDYGILTPDGDAHRRHFEETIAFLIDRGAPLDGIGMQGHFGSEVTPPEEMLAVLDRFSRFGKDIQVTEFDVDTIDEELQADFTRDLLTVCFSHPAVKGLLMWGFWEGRHWKPNGAMMRPDWSAKPNLRAYEDLVLNEWWTRARGAADSQGCFRVRGFLGDYEVEVKYGDEVSRAEVTLGPDGAAVRLKLE